MEKDMEVKRNQAELDEAIKEVESIKLEREKQNLLLQTITAQKEDIKKLGKDMDQHRINDKKKRTDFMRNEEALLEYQTLTFKQAQKIKELQQEIKQLNTKFPEEVAAYTKEIEFLKFDNENKVSELEFRYQGQTDALRVKHKETKTLRKQLQLILDQRSELEHFIIEELQQAVAAKKPQQMLHKVSSSKSTLPSVQAGPGSSLTQDLAWPSRQTVVENVFSKLNRGELPVFWRELDVSQLKHAIVRDEERKAQIRRGEVPDDSEVQKSVQRALEED